MLSHQRRELAPRKMLEQLIEEAHRLYHRLALLLAVRWLNGPAKDSSPPEQL